MIRFYYLLLFLFISCNESQPEHVVANKNIVPSQTNKEIKPIPYDSFLAFVALKRKQFKTHNEVGKFLFEIMSNEIPYYWQGTEWDFNGTTETPQKGYIACGYFVTTVLKQIGFNVNRVKLAQQASSVIIKNLCTDIQKAHGFGTFKEKVKNMPDSTVGIVGLDFHVGFILKQSIDSIFFLHSNYIKREGVVKEFIDFSETLKGNKYFVLGSISKNQPLLKKWID